MLVVIVDYGSTDNTISIIKDSYSQEDRLEFYEKLICSTARLCHLEPMCNAPLIAVVQSLSDDMINDCLSEMMDKKYLGNVGMLYGISKQVIARPPNGEVLNDFIEEEVDFHSFFYEIQERLGPFEKHSRK